MKNKSAELNFEEIENLRKEFVFYYTRDFIDSMTIEQYAMGTLKPDNFCYDLEIKQAGMGFITGTPVYKFGVWFDKKIGKYIFTKRYGNTLELAFSKVKREILSIIDAGSIDNFDAIRKNMLAPVVRYKLLAMYYPHKYLTIYSKDHLFL